MGLIACCCVPECAGCGPPGPPTGTKPADWAGADTSRAVLVCVSPPPLKVSRWDTLGADPDPSLAEQGDAAVHMPKDSGHHSNGPPLPRQQPGH